jgi:hypothetical protein
VSALVGLDIGLAVVGLAVLALFAWRLWRQVKALGRTVGTAAERVEAAQAELDAISQARDGRVLRDVHSGLPSSEGARRG